jgi:hypothetical protein
MRVPLACRPCWRRTTCENFDQRTWYESGQYNYGRSSTCQTHMQTVGPSRWLSLNVVLCTLRPPLLSCGQRCPNAGALYSCADKLHSQCRGVCVVQSYTILGAGAGACRGRWPVASAPNQVIDQPRWTGLHISALLDRAAHMQHRWNTAGTPCRWHHSSSRTTQMGRLAEASRGAATIACDCAAGDEARELKREAARMRQW